MFVYYADDYYDTEDPSVNLHEFIVNSMQVCMSIHCRWCIKVK